METFNLYFKSVTQTRAAWHEREAWPWCLALDLYRNSAIRHLIFRLNIQPASFLSEQSQKHFKHPSDIRRSPLSSPPRCLLVELTHILLLLFSPQVGHRDPAMINCKLIGCHCCVQLLWGPAFLPACNQMLVDHIQQQRTGLIGPSATENLAN